MSDDDSGTPADVVITMRNWQRVALGMFGVVWFGGLGFALYLGVRDGNLSFAHFFSRSLA